MVLNHPIICASLAILRNKNTDTGSFRKASDTICQYIIFEALNKLPVEKISVPTPFENTLGETITTEMVFIPILRSGIAMLPPVLALFPHSKIGFAGLERDEKTAVAREYYWKLPQISRETIVIITDPMLATGGSVINVLDKITRFKPKIIKIISVICAPEGLKDVCNKFQDVEIYTAVIDRKLNSRKFIIPGLGDYGDRYFGTQ